MNTCGKNHGNNNPETYLSWAILSYSVSNRSFISSFMADTNSRYPCHHQIDSFSNRPHILPVLTGKRIHVMCRVFFISTYQEIDNHNTMEGIPYAFAIPVNPEYSYDTI